mgnify:CR=1 FL=1
MRCAILKCNFESTNKEIKMKVLALLLLLTSCGMDVEHKGSIAEVPDQVQVTVTHEIDFDGITAFCELQDVNTQDCIENRQSKKR